MNIHEAITAARIGDRAIRQEKWNETACAYHGLDNILRWRAAPGCEHQPLHISIATLTAIDWCLSDVYAYHGNQIGVPVPDNTHPWCVDA